MRLYCLYSARSCRRRKKSLIVSSVIIATVIYVCLRAYSFYIQWIPIPANYCWTNSQYKEHWLSFSNGKIYLLDKFKSAKCSVSSVVRIDDYSNTFSNWVTLSSGDPVPSIGFRVVCTMPNHYYDMFHTSVPYIAEFAKETPNVHDTNNVVLIGIDSVSHVLARQHLNQSYNFISEKLSGVALNKYNIIGDGTPAALQPILSGKMDINSRPLDDQNFIFKQLHEEKYLTFWSEEQPAYAAFQFRFIGFKNEPVTFYLRPSMIEQEKYLTNFICLGTESQSRRQLKNIREMFQLYSKQPKFAFSFFAELSHENLDYSSLDHEIMSFMNWFVENQLHKNTTLILFSDHGQRFGQLRNTMEGKLGERLPLMMLALSENYRLKHPDSLKNLQLNSKRLTTPYDIHKTLHSLTMPNRSLKSKNHRNGTYSLLTDVVPPNRTCQSAGVLPHWCTQYRGKIIDNPKHHKLTKRLANIAVEKINQFVENFPNCAQLYLKEIQSAEIQKYEQSVNKFSRNLDGSFDILTTGDVFFMSLTISTTPNDALYEITMQVNHDESYSDATVETSMISRINAYGSQPNCVAKKHPYLRKFCYCI